MSWLQPEEGVIVVRRSKLKNPQLKLWVFGRFSAVSVVMVSSIFSHVLKLWYLEVFERSLPCWHFDFFSHLFSLYALLATGENCVRATTIHESMRKARIHSGFWLVAQGTG